MARATARSLGLALALALAARPALGEGPGGERGAALGTVGAADPRDAFLREARAAIEDQRYDDALAAVRPLLAQHNARWRAQALEITAEVELILGRAADARASLGQLYDLAPAFVLDDPALPPRVTAPFEAESARPHARAVPIGLRGDRLLPAVFYLVAGGDTDEVVLACRSSLAGPFAPVATTRASTLHRFELPTASPHRCYAVALDRDGLPLGRLGSPAEPVDVLAAAVPAPAPASVSTPITSRWWFYAGIGALVVGGVTVAVLARPSSPGPPTTAEVTAIGMPLKTSTVWSW